ncbi:MAG: helix-turn-helix domain-containing protein [Alphaproteobacteria bacterium]|nr:helix-turn-helix domain-containing protein [Alphaproteobacteria bacterium]MBP3515513.1 helix-turn-helix domain-containing protein [Alphaproteobacteria bacterium]
MEEIVFPNQIRINRKMRGVSMQDLADRLGISLSAISKIEKGYRRLNQEQLITVAEILDCSLQDLYVNEQNSQHEVVMAWKKEQERRQEINKSSGLKVLGAALRYIRNEKSLTLIEVAENAEMTLSVYHRIEMGQREVSDKEYKNIAKALGLELDDLKAEVKRLDEAGVLEEIIIHNDTKYKINNMNRMAADHNNLVDLEALKVPVFGVSGSDGSIMVDRGVSSKEAVKPANLFDKHDVYGVSLCTRRLGSILSSRATMFVAPSEVASVGDIALYYKTEQQAFVVSLREDETGQLYGLMWNPEERIYFDNDDFKKIHKVVDIAL